jgi:hypothetical protein
VAEPYLITYDGFGHKTGQQWTTPAVGFKVQRSGSTFYFFSAMTRDAFAGFREFTTEQLEALLVSAGLDELERRL